MAFTPVVDLFLSSLVLLIILLFLPFLSLPTIFHKTDFLFFQSPYYWPSQHHTPDNIEYAIQQFLPPNARICFSIPLPRVEHKLEPWGCPNIFPEAMGNSWPIFPRMRDSKPNIFRYAIYLYKRAQRNKKIHGLEPGLPVKPYIHIFCLFFVQRKFHISYMYQT